MTKRKNPDDKLKAGRPSSFKPEYCKQAYKLCLLGADDKRIADFFGVSTVTLNNWKNAHPEFLDSLKDGKENADSAIAASLYHRAKGYSHDAVKIFNSNGVALEVPYVEHYPPDTTAAIFWLKNRQPKYWRDKQELEHTGADGGPIKTESVLDVSKLSTEVLAEIMKASDATKRV